MFEAPQICELNFFDIHLELIVLQTRALFAASLVQHHGLLEQFKFHLSLEGHRSRWTRHHASVTTRARCRLEHDLKVAIRLSSSGDGVGRADVLADGAENAVVVNNWRGPVLQHFIFGFGAQRFFAPSPLVRHGRSLEFGIDAGERIFGYQIGCGALSSNRTR